MSLSPYEFEVLKHKLQNADCTQRELSAMSEVSLGSINKAMRSLRESGLIDDGGTVTNEGCLAIEPYRVRSAVILAAGQAVRMRPLSFESPKALFRVGGQALVERMIEQLHDAGIHKICVVVGYMKESFFYLEDKYGVDLEINPLYMEKNNYYSLWLGRSFLDNTYILPADQYYESNPFSLYEYHSYCTAVENTRATAVPSLRCNSKGIICSVGVETNGWVLRGPVYFDRTASQRMVRILDEEKDLARTASKWWHTIFFEHVTDFQVYGKKVSNGLIHEFDGIQDLVAYDADFLENVDSRILDNICQTLSCSRRDIANVTPVKEGLTNLSVLFSVNGSKYIYRHPGVGSNELVNRQAEAYALSAAARLGLDDTYIYEDPEQGWKISRYIENCVPFDYGNRKQVTQALALLRKLHVGGACSPWSFDFFADSERLITMLESVQYRMPNDFEELRAAVRALHDRCQVDVSQPVLCHNDFYGPNILVNEDGMRIIDWEYSAMGDWACDIGNFVAQGSGYSVKETIDMLHLYFGRDPSREEIRHCLAAVGIVGWYWYVWAMYKEASGSPMGEWLFTWYKAAKKYTAVALDLYE